MAYLNYTGNNIGNINWKRKKKNKIMSPIMT